MPERRPARVVLSTGPRRALITTLLLLVVLIASSLVAVSPFALKLLSPKATDWGQLSLIGQTYGAASALLAVLALIGVAVSLFQQSRESRANRAQMLRGVHTDLLRMAMEDPLYRRAWGPFFASDDSDAQREHMYVNLIVSNYQMSYELKTISEQLLRSSAYVLLSGEAGQRFWASARELRLRAASSRRERRFIQIMDEEYQRALRSPAVAPRAPSPDKGRPGRGRRVVWLIAVGASVLAALRNLRRVRARSGPPVSGRGL